MDPQTKIVLGKRARRATDSDYVEAGQDASCKRSKAKRGSATKEHGRSSTATPSRTMPSSGLLTPEPSMMSESQTAPAHSTNPSLPAPRSSFPFLSLPAELRLHIYHMALVRYKPLRLHAERPATPTEDSNKDTTNLQSFSAHHFHVPADHPINANSPRKPVEDNTAESTPPHDPVVPVILRLNWTIYNEARQLLYSENVFILSLTSGIYTLSTLHQRSRSLIKHVILTIPSHHDILDGFADLVRLGLRYCWGLKTFKIILGVSLPDDGRASGATSVYANAFHILRWLPRGCSVVLEGCVSEQVMRVVAEEGRLMSVLDETSYLKRQHQMPERH